MLLKKMKISSNDIYVSGEYYKNNPDWSVTDARWKTDVIRQLLKKNDINPKEVISCFFCSQFNCLWRNIVAG